MKFSIKDFFSKCDHIRRKLRIWTHLLKKSLIENFIFCAVAAGDLNIDVLNLTKIKYLYNCVLSNFVSGVTCVKSKYDKSFDVISCHRPGSFHNTCAIETGLTHCHKMIVSFPKAYTYKFLQSL